MVFEDFLQGEGCYLRKQDAEESPVIGYIRLNDAINYRYVVHFLNSNGEIRYRTVDELINDGWRADN